MYAIDAVPSRLAIAQKFGNVVPVNFKEQDVIKTIQKEVPGGLDGGSSLLFSGVKLTSSLYRRDHLPRAEDPSSQGREGFDVGDRRP